MRRMALWLAGLSLLATLLAGCGQTSEGGQDVADATVGGQAAANMTPSPEVVDPNEADANSQAAGEVPSILGSTPESGQVGGWERREFWDTWSIGYPDGWQVEEGAGSVVVSGAYGEKAYRVELAQPTDVAGDDVESWAKADLAALGQPDAALAKVPVTGVDAYKASNLALQAEGNDTCPSARVYGQEGDPTGALHRLVLTVTQTSNGECENPTTERLADAIIAEARLK